MFSTPIKYALSIISTNSNVCIGSVPFGLTVIFIKYYYSFTFCQKECVKQGSFEFYQYYKKWSFVYES